MRRGTAAHRRAHPHVPAEDPQAPGCCATCRLPLGKQQNQLHLERLPDVPADITEAEARRLGERTNP